MVTGQLVGALSADVLAMPFRDRELLNSRAMTMTRLSRTTDITIVNPSILKTGKAKAVRFSTSGAGSERSSADG